MHLIMLACFASGSIILSFTAGQLFQIITRKDSAMANKSADLNALVAAVVALINAKDAEIADLKSQLAAVDPTASADLAADEQAITDASAALTGAGVVV